MAEAGLNKVLDQSEPPSAPDLDGNGNGGKAIGTPDVSADDVPIVAVRVPTSASEGRRMNLEGFQQPAW